MNVDVRSVHFDLGAPTRDYLDKKLERLNFAKDTIVTVDFAFTKEKDFICESTIHFRWGHQAHIQERDFELAAGIDKLIDKMEMKVRKEKEKVQDRNK